VKSVIFLVPGFFTNETLGLLLGIAQDCGVPARGVVDTAVAASPELVSGRSLLHMDIHLHATVLTELVAAGGVARGKVQVLEAVGLAGLEQNWMATTAEAFVRQTRFDPLHDAGTEQVLADGLSQWLSALVDQAETGIELQRGERTLTASVTRRQLIEVAAPLYERLARMVDTARLTSGPVTLKLSHRLGRLPGLADRLREIDDVEVENLPEGQAVLGALERSGDILSPGENVRFTTMLPLHRAGALPVDDLPPPPIADTRPRPTHLLAGSVVYRISEQQITVGAAPPADQRPVVVSGGVEGVSRRHCSIFRRDEDIVVADHSRYGTFLNDRKVQGEAVLAVGDVIRVGSPGSSFVLVEARD
jgi:hypothetical protein